MLTGTDGWFARPKYSTTLNLQVGTSLNLPLSLFGKGRFNWVESSRRESINSVRFSDLAVLGLLQVPCGLSLRLTQPLFSKPVEFPTIYALLCRTAVYVRVLRLHQERIAKHCPVPFIHRSSVHNTILLHKEPYSRRSNTTAVSLNFCKGF